MADKKISQLTGATTPLAGTEELPLVQSGVTKKVTVAQIQAAPVAASTASAVVVLDAAKVPQATPALTFDGNTLALTSSVIASLNLNKTSSTGGLSRYILTSPTAQYGWYIPDNANFASFYDYLANAERINVDSSGNVKVSTGNLVIGTAGKGIDFSADGQAAGMTSELLDDYEEGTWTPADASGAGLVLTISYAKYIKIGRTVFINAFFNYPSTADVSAASISGLPFAVESNNYAPFTVASSAIDLNAFCNATTTNFNFVSPASYSTAITNNSLSTAGVVISGCYFAS